MNGMRTGRRQEAAGATREEPRYRPGVRTGRRGRGSGGAGPAVRRSGSAAGSSHAIAADRRLGNFMRTSGGGAGIRAAGSPVRARAGSPGAAYGPDPHGRPGRVPRHHRRPCSRRAGPPRAPGARPDRLGIGHPGDWRSGCAAVQAEAGGGTRCGGLPVSAEGSRVEQLSCRRALTSAAGRSEVLSKVLSKVLSEVLSEVLWACTEETHISPAPPTGDSSGRRRQ